MATDRTNIGYKFEDGDIPSQADFQEVFNSFIHKDEDKADFQMVEEGRDNLHYVTPALLYTGLKNIGIITGNNYMPRKEHFDSFIGDTITLQYAPINYSVKVFKNGQLLLEKEGQGNDGDYIINYEMAKITFSGNIDNRNIEVDYWYKNLSPNSNPGGGSGQQIDFTSFLHTSGNETKNGILTFNNTTPTSTSGIVLTNSGADAAAKVLDVTVSGAGSGIAVQNTATGTGIKVSNTGSGAGLQVNSSATATGDPLQVLKDNVINAKIDTEGKVTAKNFITSGGLDTDFVKGDGSLDDTVYAEDTKVIHTSGNETKDGALKLTHNDSVEDVLTIIKSNSANCLKLVQNSTSNATTSTIDTNAENVNRKAISIQKKQIEKAFITHDGNVSGTSFTTLNEKADITDGFLTLAASTSATAMAGHAKLYAKTNGTTDLYVMGSDGVEKKIGAEVDLSGKENTIAAGTTTQYFRGDKTWQTLDKTAIGLSNVENTSDLNKPVSTATQTALNAKQATLVSGTNIKTINGTTLLGSGDITISGGGATITGTANKLAKFNSTGNNITNSNITDTGSLVTIDKPTKIDSGTNDNSGLTLSKLPTSIAPSEIPIATGLNYSVSIAYDSINGFAFQAEAGGTVRKINISTGVSSILPLTGLTIPDGTYGNNICIDPAGNLYVSSNAKVFKIDTSNVVTLLATITDYTTTIIYGLDGALYAISIWGQLTKITLSGTVTIISNTSSPSASALCQDNQGNFYIGSTNYPEIYKIAAGTSSPVLFYTHSRGVLALITKNSTSIWIVNNGTDQLDQLDLASKALAPNSIPVNTIFPRDGFIDKSGSLCLIGSKKSDSSSYILEKIIMPTAKVLKTDATGLLVKTTYLEDIPYVKADENGNPINQVLTSLDSPNFTGIPTAPTAAAGTNTNQLATTAFVMAATNGNSSSSGSFTPTLTPMLNCSSITLKSATYTKVGNIVTVMVTANGTVTTASSTTFLDISLPINRAGTTAITCGSGSLFASTNITPYWGEIQIQSGQKARLIAISPPNITGDNFVFIASFQYNIND